MTTRRFRGDWARDQIELVRILNDFDKRLKRLEQAIKKREPHQVALEDEQEPSSPRGKFFDEEE